MAAIVQDYHCDHHGVENCEEYRCVIKYVPPLIQDAEQRLAVLRRIHKLWMLPTTTKRTRAALSVAVDKVYGARNSLV